MSEEPKKATTSTVRLGDVKATYESRTSAGRAETSDNVGTAAVFVAHGMGQQIPFSTLEQVANGLARQHEKARKLSKDEEDASQREPQVRTSTILHEGERIQRLELRLPNRNIHIYEGYWAPLTEGRVRVGDVTRFLLRAGWNGLRGGSRAFRRWIFGEPQRFYVSPSAVLGFLASLLLLLSLAVYDCTLIAVVVLQFIETFISSKHFLSADLYRELTAIFCAVFLAVYTGGLFVVAGRWFKPQIDGTREDGAPRHFLRASLWDLGWRGVALATVAMVAGAVGVLLVATRWLWYTAVKADADTYVGLLEDASSLDPFLINTGAVLWTASILLVGTLSIRKLISNIVASGERTGVDQWSWMSKAALYVFYWLLFLFAYCAVGLAMVLVYRTVDFVVPVIPEGFRVPDAYAVAATGGVSWVLLIIASVLIRKLMVQYVGDVAAYISSYELDRFHDLRRNVRDRVTKQLEAVYSHRGGERGTPYDEVFVMGHSLGSVVSYDALNRLILQDEAIGRGAASGLPGGFREALGVVDRTKLFLTFGSPLDKTAYLFTQQGAKSGDVRELLAAEVQPLIRDKSLRPFPWVNVWSRADFISSRLDYYGEEADWKVGASPCERYRQPGPGTVRNREDLAATTLIGAHTEYWSNSAIFEELYCAIMKPWKKKGDSPSAEAGDELRGRSV